MNIGRERLRYLLSFGSYKNFDFHMLTEFYPGFYNTMLIFITKMFPVKYEIQTWHIFNSLISVGTIFGIYKITCELFNKYIGKIVFLFSFFNPIFFGHMAINSKDTIIAFANIWCTYLIIKYLKNQNHNKKRNRYILLLGLTVGLGLGTRVAFLATLIPVTIFFILDIFFIKKIKNIEFSNKKLFFDLFKIFIISYFVMVSCWANTHANIIILPFKIFYESLSLFNFGSPIGLLNGNLYYTADPPYFYFLINLFYKLPEFILLGYILFLCLIPISVSYFKKQFNFFYYKIFFILFVLIFPNLLVILSPYRVYDGVRLFLYTMPYLSIIPALLVYYLIINKKKILSKILLSITTLFLIYHLFIFLSLTPYQYTYLNFFNGSFSKSNLKFENDYWAVSIKELTKKINKKTDSFSNQELKIAFCGLPHNNARKELGKISNLKFQQQDLFNGEFDFVMMTNKTFIDKDKFSWKDKDPRVIQDFQSCFDKFKGKDIVSVKRNGLTLSTLRKID